MEFIRIRGARQNNLKNLTLDLPTNELIVVTGVSGSGKSSLVFDTLYAEGQRRYVETFSPYARQFLDRQDRPQVDAIEGIPPAIAIDQTNPVRTSRSTVGTMTELNDHFKLLYARAAELYCRGCGAAVTRDTPQTILHALTQRAAAAGDPRLTVAFPVPVPANFNVTEVKKLLEAQGYSRFLHENEKQLEVIQDRFRAGTAEPARVVDALEAALRVGHGRVNVHATSTTAEASNTVIWKFSTGLHCPDCDIHYQNPTPSLFSFNSPLGACDTCRGFGRVIGVDYGLVIPDESKTLRAGAVKPWQTPSNKECQDDLERYAKKRGIPLDTPWRDLTKTQQRWVTSGEPEWESWKKSWPGVWYGVARFFKWLESKAYKMHVRVLLSKYRAYTPCEACGGARLKTEALSWRLGSEAAKSPFLPVGAGFDEVKLAHLPGLTVHDLMLLPLDTVRTRMQQLTLPQMADDATAMLLKEIRTRLAYLADVGLGYLTLDRQSRTLSGGEVQRINLTTALGTSLTNTLFVLDEPSIGLHPRDMGRVIGVMHKLRDAGNSLVVVEHDPQVMQAADRILDMGPGPGERGGEIVYFGEAKNLIKTTTSRTGQYLAGTLRADSGVRGQAPRSGVRKLELRGVTEHNLRNIDVAIPLGHLVCITGVSGSGKSTLVQDVLYAALMKAKGKPSDTPGAHRALLGHEHITDAVMVDQSPIGRTTRSNPASYVGAFDAIRDLYTRAPLARERSYTAGTFSFNSGNGRCPACGGNGFEHVEMQFLSDVYLRCADCDGRRYRQEILEIHIEGKSIADVLDMTVSEALAFFAAEPKVGAALRPLAEVGLEYLRLGQPVPTLSGGEAQRLKLAGHLAEAARSATAKRPALFLFDEPTTGLHFEDIAKLLGAFRELIAAGHSLVVIEHNLDVIRASDWIVDLGPEGGDAGGEIVCTGTPDQVMAHETSHTGRALRTYEASLAQQSFAAQQPAEYVARPAVKTLPFIKIHHAREHNLKNIDVDIPRGKFTVVTGVSGSGKSTLAFDILFAEGQRRYLESLNAYARQFVQGASRPDVDSITGIPPTVAIEQRTSRGGRKSTVATLTEIYHFLRLLYVKLGTQYCPDCDVAIEPQSADAIVASIMKQSRGDRVGLLAPLVMNRKGYYTDLAKWAAAKGHTHLRVDGEFLPTGQWPRLARFSEHTIELPVADVHVLPENENQLRAGVAQALEHGKGNVHVIGKLNTLARAIEKHDPTMPQLPQTAYSANRACPSCSRSFPELDPRLFSFNSRHGWCPACYGTGLKLAGFDWDAEREKTGTEEHVLDSWLEWLEIEEPCPACDGHRLNRDALAVRFDGQSIAQLTSLPVSRVAATFGKLSLKGRAAEIARDVLTEIHTRLTFLDEVGLGYLALDRAAPTLSGGEAQRIRLAAQLGSNLRGVCYILDEPTIGLHPRDNKVLLDTLQKLEAKGNTLVVVEHDEDTIRRAAHVIDLGPGAGKVGGEVIGEGTADDLMRNPQSITGRFLLKPLLHPLHPPRVVNRNTEAIQIRGATLHNLKKIDVRIPLARFTAITGVSGSGKSTLARDVLHAQLSLLLSKTHVKNNSIKTNSYKALANWQSVGRVLEVDQTPIGKTPRSCPATYVGFWDAIRRLFAEVPEARMRGYSASRFSFNTSGGRCETCEGQGMRKIEMSFLPDVRVACETCHGARFNTDTLAVLFKGKSAGDVLRMNIDEAVEFFAAHPAIHHALTLLQDVGLGYLTLGQQSPTLSGGEAQRIKLVTELSKVRTDIADAAQRAGRAWAQKSTLYVLDEPTVGLHMADVEKLIRVLHRLVDAGNTVVLIEHNLDVIADADWIIDLGPEGGDAGGRIVAQGTPQDLARQPQRSHTSRVLAEFLATRSV